ncbi:MAG: Uma2 family endonuclease [Neolewinella sp.]|jgi:Uma2 family endonuclease
MSVLAPSDRKYTEQEYFDFLTKSDLKYEFHDGQITMMAGGKRAHNLAQRNTFSALDQAKGTCTVYNSDTAVHISKLNKYYFPDIMALCGKEGYSDEGAIERVLNPQLLVEVLSKSTEKKDRGEKFDAYKTLDSFKEYVIIDSKIPHVYTYYREEKGLWRIGNYYEMDQEVEFITLGVKVPMSVIYDGVEFEE